MSAATSTGLSHRPDGPHDGREEKPNEPIVTPTHINERALRYQVLVKRQLSRAVKDLAATQDRLKRYEAQERGAARAERAIAAGKRLRDEDMAPAVEDGESGAGTSAAHGEVEMAPAAAAAEPESAVQISTSGEAGEIEEPAADPPPQEATEMEDADAAAQQQPAKPEVDGGDGPETKQWTMSGQGNSFNKRSPRERMAGADDGASRQRNRRMFGALMGTLKRAQKEVESSAGLTQAKIQKIDEKLRTDRTKQIEQQKEVIERRKAADLIRKESLIDERKELDAKLRRLIAIAHEASLCHFIKTKATPPIYFMPAVQNASTKKLLSEQQSAVLKPLDAELTTLSQLPVSTHDKLGPPETGSLLQGVKDIGEGGGEAEMKAGGEGSSPSAMPSSGASRLFRKALERGVRSEDAEEEEEEEEEEAEMEEAELDQVVGDAVIDEPVVDERVVEEPVVDEPVDAAESSEAVDTT